MADYTSDHARSRAMELLAIADPVSDDEGSRRLRALAVRYLEFRARPEGGIHDLSVYARCLSA